MRVAAPLTSRRASRIGVAIAFCLCVDTALASPEGQADPLLQLLAEKGLLPPASASTEPPAEARAGLLGKVQDRASDLVVTAINFLGVRYRKGGSSADTGFDCSGFTRHIFGTSLGLALPRRADEQAAAPGLAAVRREDLRPGDLVFFNTMKRTFSHVGIYIGENRFIHAPSSGKDVRTDDLGFAYWAKRFTGARRAVVAAAEPVATEPASF